MRATAALPALLIVAGTLTACGAASAPAPPAHSVRSVRSVQSAQPSSSSGASGRSTAPSAVGGPRPPSRTPDARSATTSTTRPTPADRPSSAQTASPAALPPVSARARSAGLVDVRTVVPDAVIDLRYATAQNFTHRRLYPPKARCLVHRSLRAGLRAAAAALRRQGLVLVFWDCYRPHAVQQRMFRIVPNPAWVAKPGPYARSHEAGRSVDVTLGRAASGGRCATQAHGHCLLPMGTGFDDFTPRAFAWATDGISRRAVRNRARLRTALAAGGLSVYSGEWWHFDGPGAGTPRPVLDAPVY